MSRKRASWSWVGDYPVFIYTTWLNHRVFNVDIVIGEKGNQNAEGYGPTAKPDKTYTETRFYDKDSVVSAALKSAKVLIERRGE